MARALHLSSTAWHIPRALVASHAHPKSKSTGVHAMQKDTPLKILAFGDSLTEGFHNDGRSFHPYGIKLSQLITTNVDSNAEVGVEGLSGGCVIPPSAKGIDFNFEGILEPMVARLPPLLAEAAASGHPYDWVLILGGINDVGCGRKGADVFGGLQQMYQMCQDHGASVLAMTILESQYTSMEKEDDEVRCQINELIRGHVQSSQGKQATMLLDLDMCIPWTSMDASLRSNIWDDGLHLTPEGYDFMGELIFTVLQPKLATRH